MLAPLSLRASRTLLTPARLLAVSPKPTPASTRLLYRQRLPARFFSVSLPIAANMSDAPTKTASTEDAKPIGETIKETVNAAATSVGAVIPSAEDVKNGIQTTQANIAAAVPSTEIIQSGVETAKANVQAAVTGTNGTQTSGEKPSIRNLTEQADFDREVNDKSSLLVIDFYATWCGPCKVIAPQIVKFAQKYPNVRFFNLDVDDLPALSKELNIRAMPTFVLYQGGEKVATVVGANPKALEAAIQAQLNGPGPEVKAEVKTEPNLESDMEAALKAEFDAGDKPAS